MREGEKHQLIYHEDPVKPYVKGWQVVRKSHNMRSTCIALVQRPR